MGLSSVNVNSKSRPKGRGFKPHSVLITPQTEPSKIFVPDNYGDSSDEEVLRKAEEWLGKNFDFAESLVQAINNYGCEFFEDGTLYQ